MTPRRNTDPHVDWTYKHPSHVYICRSSQMLVKYYFTQIYKIRLPVPVAARSKTWVCGRSPAEIVGSNPTGGHGCLSVVSVLCCQVEVSATGWSLAQRGSTDCGASLCVIYIPREWGGHGPLGAVAPETNIKYDLKHLNCALYEDVRDVKRVQNSWPLNMEPIGCPETSVMIYHYSLLNNPEERSCLTEIN